MPALLIYPDGIIFLLTKEHSSVFPFQWVWRNEFSVLICLKLFLFHLQFWCTVSQAMKFSVACYFLSALWRYCFLILWFLFFFFLQLFILLFLIWEHYVLFLRQLSGFLLSSIFTFVYYDLVCYCSLLKTNPYYSMLFNLRLKIPIPHSQMFTVLHSCSSSRTAAVNSFFF